VPGLDEHTLSLFREVERARSGRLLRYLCEHFLEVWCPTLVSERAYEAIYLRDGYRCSNPVCRRRDVTPHHLVFRSKGGGDEPENLTALCCWCHLQGVHGGRIVARPVEGRIHWRIGRVAPTLVHDRDKLAA